MKATGFNRWRILAVATVTMAICGISPVQARAHRSFDRAVHQSDTKMIHAMRHAPVNGNPDHDFLVKMMPHHQGAIDMARAELKYGKDPKIKNMARKMIEDQQRDLVKMRRQLRRMQE